MAKKILTLLALLNLSALCSAESKNLFNGKDLTGWTGNPEFWKVENGIIVGLLNKGMKVSSILEDVNLANHIKKSSSNFKALVQSYSDEPMVNPFEKDVQVALDLAATFNPIPFASRSDIIASQQAALTKFNIAHNSNKSLLPLMESPITKPSSSTASLPISTHHLPKPSNPSNSIGTFKDTYIKGVSGQKMLGYHEVSFLADVIERPIAVVRKVQQQPRVETIYTSEDIKDKPPVYVINFNNFHFEAWKPSDSTQNTLNVGDVCSGNAFKANRGSGNSKSNDCLLDSLRSFDDVNAMLTKKIGNNQDIRGYLGSKLQSVDASYFASNQVNRFEVKSSQYKTSFLSSDFVSLGWCSQCCLMGNGLRGSLHRLGGLTLLECLITRVKPRNPE